jgi:hypothetical protein
MEERYAFVLQRIDEGASFYKAQTEAKERFGKSVGYSTIQKLLAERRSVTTPSRALVAPVELPPEVLEPVTPPQTEGAQGTFRDLRTWMKRVGAEEFTINANGEVNVLVRHRFTIEDLK